jgi:hypothetical protein
MIEPSEMPQLGLNTPLRPRPPGCVVPLTTMQRMQLKFTKKQSGSLSTRLRAASLRILGPLNAELLENCIDAVLQRHEALRTRIAEVDGTPIQIVDAPRRYRLPVVDMTGTSTGDLEVEARRLAQAFLAHKVDLSVGPVFGAELLRFSERDHVLLLGLDHIAGDALSNGILCREVWTLYNEETRHLPPSLPALSLQFGDYAFWQHQTHKARQQKHESFWTEELKGANCIEIPNDFESQNQEQTVATVLSLPLGKARSDSLREAARREQTLLPIVVLTTYLVAIAHWSKAKVLTVPFVSHGRHNRPELQNMIGFLARMLWFRIEIAEDERLVDLLKRVHFKFMSAIQHQEFVPDFPEEFNRELLFNWGAVPGYSTRSSVEKLRGSVDGLAIQPFHVQDPWSHKLLTLYSDTPAGIVAVVRYRADMLAKANIDRLGRHLRVLADAIAHSPFSTVGTVLK